MHSTVSKTLMASVSLSTTKGPQAATKMKKVVAPPLYLAKATPMRSMTAEMHQALPATHPEQGEI